MNRSRDLGATLSRFVSQQSLASVAVVAALAACGSSTPNAESSAPATPAKVVAGDDTATCSPTVEPVAVEPGVCASYVALLREPRGPAPPFGDRAVADHLARFPRTPAWLSRYFVSCDQAPTLSTAGELLLATTRGCDPAEEVLRQLGQLGTVTTDVVWPAAAEALEACDCALAATDAYVSLLVYLTEPRDLGPSAVPSP